jgi:hypothetical protein
VAHTIQQRGAPSAGPQAKLATSQSGDASEREADAWSHAIMYNQVMPRLTPVSTSTVARKESSQTGAMAEGVWEALGPGEPPSQAERTANAAKERAE